jgi:hypothetical protein
LLAGRKLLGEKLCELPEFDQRGVWVFNEVLVLTFTGANPTNAMH